MSIDDQEEFDTDMAHLKLIADAVIEGLPPKPSEALWAAWMPNLYEQMVTLFGQPA